MPVEAAFAGDDDVLVPKENGVLVALVEVNAAPDPKRDGAALVVGAV